MVYLACRCYKHSNRLMHLYRLIDDDDMFVGARYDRLLVPSTQFVLPDLFNALSLLSRFFNIQNHYRFYDHSRTWFLGSDQSSLVSIKLPLLRYADNVFCGFLERGRWEFLTGCLRNDTLCAILDWMARVQGPSSESSQGAARMGQRILESRPTKRGDARVVSSEGQERRRRGIQCVVYILSNCEAVLTPLRRSLHWV
jgi:hypothetical protein